MARPGRAGRAPAGAGSRRGLEGGRRPHGGVRRRGPPRRRHAAPGPPPVRRERAVRLPGGRSRRAGRPAGTPPDRARRTLAFVSKIASLGMEVTEPAAVPGLDQPVVTPAGVVSLWTYYDADPGCRVTPREPGGLLRRFHETAASAADLVDRGSRSSSSGPGWPPPAATASRPAILGPLDDSLAALAQAVPAPTSALALGRGVIHGDMHYGNVLCLPRHRHVLIDFDQIAHGPLEWDLAPSLVTHRRAPPTASPPSSRRPWRPPTCCARRGSRRPCCSGSDVWSPSTLRRPANSRGCWPSATSTRTRCASAGAGHRRPGAARPAVAVRRPNRPGRRRAVHRRSRRAETTHPVPGGLLLADLRTGATVHAQGSRATLGGAKVAPHGRVF